MSSDDDLDLEIPDFDQGFSDSEDGESSVKKTKNIEKIITSSTAKNISEKSKKISEKASLSPKIPASKSTSSAPNNPNVKKICKFCDQDLTRWKFGAEKFQEHVNKCEAKKHLHQFIRKNNANVFLCQFCPKANVRYNTMLKHVEEKHTESTVSQNNIYKKCIFPNSMEK